MITMHCEDTAESFDEPSVLYHLRSDRYLIDAASDVIERQLSEYGNPVPESVSDLLREIAERFERAVAR